MLNSKPLDKLIFLDIESVPQTKSFFDMNLNKQELFLKKFKKDAEAMIGLPMDLWDVSALKDIEGMPAKLELFYNNRAALHAEFCQIVVISVGWFVGPIPADLKALSPDQVLDFKTKSFYGSDEKKLLQEFYVSMKSVLDKSFAHDRHMVAFNGKVFDFPVIAKRMLILGMSLPPFFDVSEMKPWDMVHLVDPKETWKWGVFDGNSSLAILCEVFGVPSSKDDIHGGQVRDVYYVEGDIQRIAIYCSKDVSSLAILYLRMKGIKNNINVV